MCKIDRYNTTTKKQRDFTHFLSNYLSVVSDYRFLVKECIENSVVKSRNAKNSDFLELIVDLSILWKSEYKNYSSLRKPQQPMSRLVANVGFLSTRCTTGTRQGRLVYNSLVTKLLYEKRDNATSLKGGVWF